MIPASGTSENYVMDQSVLDVPVPSIEASADLSIVTQRQRQQRGNDDTTTPLPRGRHAVERKGKVVRSRPPSSSVVLSTWVIEILPSLFAPWTKLEDEEEE